MEFLNTHGASIEQESVNQGPPRSGRQSMISAYSSASKRGM